MAFFCAMAVSAESFTVDNLTYTVNNDGKSVTLTEGRQATGDLVIPDAVNGYTVTAIGKGAFGETPSSIGSGSNTAITSLVLPSTLVTIGEYAFSGCTSLTGDIVIPNSVESIGEYAFAYDYNVSTFTLPKNPKYTTITFASFGELYDPKSLNAERTAYTVGLKEVTIPANVTTIEYGAFCEDFCLHTIHWEEGSQLTSLAKYAFLECIKLKEFALPEGFTTIEPETFTASGIQELTIPTTVKSLPARALYHMSSLRKVVFPNTVESIGDNCMQDCAKLTHVTFSDGITTFGSNIFEGCKQLSEVTLPASTVDCGPLASTLDGYALNSIYVTGEQIPEGLKAQAGKDKVTIYVKKSVYDKFYSTGEWEGFKVSYKIPLTLKNNYATLCRDFDVDFGTAVTDSKLSVLSINGVEDNRVVLTTEEIQDKYVPSRLDTDGDQYNEFTGILVYGKKGETYYYTIGEKSGYAAPDGNCLMGAVDDKIIHVADDFNPDQDYYGLNNNEFKIYSRGGTINYNRAWLSMPGTVTHSAKKLTFTDAPAATGISKADIADVEGADSRVYTLDGKPLFGKYKGIVIKKNRKFVSR